MPTSTSTRLWCRIAVPGLERDLTYPYDNGKCCYAPWLWNYSGPFSSTSRLGVARISVKFARVLGTESSCGPCNDTHRADLFAWMLILAPFVREMSNGGM